jgi:predicted GNAT family N-acyltransferase
MNKAIIRIADWHNPNDRKALRMIRQRIFIEEQQVPVELEWDEFDDSSTHFLASIDNLPVATARLKTDGQFGRMAVLAECRHQHIGSTLLRFVMQQAKKQNLKTLHCHAQIRALDFYRRHGFNINGDEFDDAGIPHREMTIQLD